MEKNFKQDQQTTSNQNWKSKDKDVKGAGAETYPTGQGTKGGIDPKKNEQKVGGRENVDQGAQDASMKTGRPSDVKSADLKDRNQGDESADFADDSSIDKDDSTKSFAADSKSRGTKENDVQSRPSIRGSQNSRQ